MILPDQIVRIKRVLRPLQEETIDALNKSLVQFNANYKKIISAIKPVTKAPTGLPDSMSLDFIKSQA